MNYGRKGITQKKKILNSATTRFRTKLGVTLIKMFLILVIALIVSGACFFIGSIQGIIASAPDINDIDVSPDGLATKIYDDEGNEIQSLSSNGANRILVGIESIPVNLQHAFVAVEDERFYEHNGIDMKGIARAVYITLHNKQLSQGASTITQQLIKNNVFNAYNESDVEKIKRKVQEQYLALKLETCMSKSEILEDYLNTINLGNGYYGVQTAANGYFNKDVSELTLSECAVIASITKNPSRLNPVKSPEANSERQQKVLGDMLSQGYITPEEYEDAIADDVYARIESNDVSNGNSTYSYFVDALIEQLIKDLVEQKGYTETQANNLIYKGGLTVKSTQNSDMQNIANEYCNDLSFYPDNTSFSINYALSVKNEDGKTSHYSHTSMLKWYQNELGDSSFDLTQSNKYTADNYVEKYKEAMTANGGTVVGETLTYVVQPQVSMSIMDWHNGQIKAIVGGRGEKTGSRTLNRATDSTRQPGSSIKPLAVYGPALDTGAITLATAVDDSPYHYPNGQLVKNYTAGEYKGLMTVREAIKLSQNIPAVKIMELITPQTGFNYLEKFGISTLVSPQNEINGSNDVVLPLALGGMTLGVHNIDMTAAYSSIANGGVYNKPIYYTTVCDRKGNIIIDNTKAESHRVLKEDAAWLLNSGMQSVLTTKAASAANIPDITVSGKTGTTQNYSDKWFCGFTPYYAAAVWMGYDDNTRTLPSSNYQVAVWGAVMNKIHEKLAPADFEQPSSIVQLSVCSQSGKLPVDGLCDSDPRGSTIITEYFSKENQPTEHCDTHVRVNVCNDSGQVAGVYCPHTSQRVYIKKSASTFSDMSSNAPYETYDADFTITDEKLTKICSLHTSAVQTNDNITNIPGVLPNNTNNTATTPNNTNNTQASNNASSPNTNGSNPNANNAGNTNNNNQATQATQPSVPQSAQATQPATADTSPQYQQQQPIN